MDRQAEFDFYKELGIPKAAIIFDIGSNIGDKSYMFSKLASSVIAAEPDRFNFNLLKKRFSHNRKVHVVNVAVGEKADKATFYVTSSGSPANTLSKKWKEILEDPEKNRWSKSLSFENSYEVDMVTLEQLILLHSKPYYIKIDVEGFELQVLKGLKSTIPLMSIEANFPEFREETIECVQVIKQLSEKTTFNCIDPKHKFLWEIKKTPDQMIDWLRCTPLKYFEIFAFN